MADKCLSVGVHCASQPTVNHKRVALSDQLVVLRKKQNKKTHVRVETFSQHEAICNRKKELGTLEVVLRLLCGYSAVTLRLL